MTRFIASHQRAFKAEWLKLRSTGIFWLTLGVALFVPAINVLVSLLVNESTRGGNLNDFVKSSYLGFTGFFYPLFLVITTLRIVYVEHRSDTWKLVNTQPVSRFALFIVKYEVILILALLALLGVLIFSLIGSLVLVLGRPDASYAFSQIRWSEVASATLRFWIAAFGMVAIQYFISLIVKSFAWPMTIGLVAIIAGSILINFSMFNWFPYVATLLTNASYSGGSAGYLLMPHEQLSLLWALLLLAAGFFYYKKQTLRKAFFATPLHIAATVAVLVVAFWLFWWVNRPVELQRYGKTVLAGTITTQKPVQQIVVARPPFYDTVMAGKIVGEKFHITTDADLESGMYVAKAGPVNFSFYFSKGDSLFVTIDQSSSAQVKFSGTRLAENEYLQKHSGDRPFFTYNMEGTTPTAFAKAVRSEWESQVEKLEKFRTAENIRPADDFINYQKRRIAVGMLTYLNIEYPKTFAIYNPNDTLKYPAYVHNMQKEISYNDEQLLGSGTFLDYLTAYAHTKFAYAENKDRALLKFALDSIQSQQVRDAFLYKATAERINTVRDSIRRNSMVHEVMPLIASSQMKQQLMAQAHRLNKMSRGMKAPSFRAVSVTGKDVTLEQLANRYLVIDVWATWCVPCKREAPYFDEMARKYTGPSVAFLSISIDEKKEAWRFEATRKGKEVMQLWATHAEEDFANGFAVNTIPRFMLIDPKGRIVHAQMPMPSEDEFEQILQKEIVGLSMY